jgi:mannose-6-phosphate isomerase-like protein (cupin superfamily)
MVSQQQPVSKHIDQPEDTRTFPNGRVELVKIGGVTVGKATFQPGWRWSNDVKPIAKTESCQAAHTAYIISGRIHVRMDDGTEVESGPGEVAYTPPGHDGWVVGNEPLVMLDFSGLENYAK